MNSEVYKQICTELETQRINGNPYWSADPQTVEVIISFIKRVPHVRVLEVGCSNGHTALRLVPSLLGVGGSLVTIESHRARGEVAEKNFERAEVKNIITLVRGHAPEIFGELLGMFDVVFLDATKCEHVSYVEQLFPLLSPRAIIMADNVFSHGESMKPFVYFMQSLSNFSVEIKDIGTGLLVAQKRV